MRRTFLILAAMLEGALALVLGHLYYRLPATAEVEHAFDTSGRIVDRTGKQVRLLRRDLRTLRDPELLPLAMRVQRETNHVASQLRDQVFDDEAVRTLRDALHEAAEGLDGLAETLETAHLDKVRQALGHTAQLLDVPAVPAPPAADPQPALAALAGAGASLKAVFTEMGSVLPPKTRAAFGQSGSGTVAALKNLARPLQTRFAAAFEPPPGKRPPPNPRITWPDLSQRREAISILRQAEQGFADAAEHWPQRRKTLARAARLLRLLCQQIDHARNHRLEYEQTIRQTASVAEDLADRLPELTERFESQLQEEEGALQELDRGLSNLHASIPGYAHSTVELVQMLRWLVALAAATLLIHASTLVVRTAPKDSTAIDTRH